MSELMHARVIENLVRLRLKNAAVRLDALLSDAMKNNWPMIQLLDELLREEVSANHNKRIAMGLQIAHFPAVKTMEGFDFKFQPSIDNKLVRELATSRFVANGENVLLLGSPGVGKTHLAIALGRCAVEHGYTTLFTTATALIAALAKAESDGNLTERVAFYSKPKLLIVDELGYLPFEKRSAHLLFQLIARRYERSSTLITTNQPETQWGSVFGDEVIASAILDRLLHHSHTMTITGDSYRLKNKRRAGLIPPPNSGSNDPHRGGQD